MGSAGIGPTLKWLLGSLLAAVLLLATAELMGVSDFSTKLTTSYTPDEHMDKKAVKYDPVEYIPLSKADKLALVEGATLSKEYQIKMQNFRFYPRENNVRHFLEQISAIYGIPEILDDPGKESTRGQWTMDLRPCEKTRNFRIRRYYTGEMAHTTTVDIKASSTDEQPDDVVQQSFFLANSSLPLRTAQKFEEDIHPCHKRWSMETRIYGLPFDYWLDDCGQCNILFPHCQPKESLDEYSHVSPGIFLETWWWELEHHGTMFDGSVRYKTALTLIYKSIDDAIAGVVRPKGYSEWSIRIWSADEGKGAWNRDVLQKMDKNYRALLIKFSDTPDFPCKEQPGETPFEPRDFAFHPFE